MADCPANGPRLGLIVNPIAGLGGRVGLKGTDGSEVVAMALARGAEPQAGIRAAAALGSLRSLWPHDRPRPTLLAGHGRLGAEAAEAAGYHPMIVGGSCPITTSPTDTRRLAIAMQAASVDLLLYAGGDGTARDIMSAVNTTVATLGIPAGVKIESAVFATSPATAGSIAATFLTARPRRCVEREVLDLDEDAYRRGEVAPHLHGYLIVPADRFVQSAKAPSPTSEAGAMAAIAAEVVGRIELGRRYVLGPGTTIQAIAKRLGVAKTLVGVDVIEVGRGGPRLVQLDASDRQVRAAIARGPFTIIVTPIGGQGFLVGRGNQQLSPEIIGAAGRSGIAVVATPGKLAALGGRPLLVDTGDGEVDRSLSGYVRVITGLGQEMVVELAPA
jgi:predicted polyphosphate/ATP-dependent NAD kinase